MSPVYLFFNLGGGEIFFVFLFVLLLFGANKIPEFARGLGKGIRYIKDATQDIQSDIKNSVDDIKKDVDPGISDIKKEIDDKLKNI
ncbi:MAG TPA: twin-arginine translocase TatA/TatE family subunit [Flavobacteriales bacterium]|jgi:sec-independent protein translocase protein TatA|nr:twin-arginine translocase TatA/TatE family subunit [Flavobacteriales bacterium]